MTRDGLPFRLILANSIGSRGPSDCQFPEARSVPGFQYSEPQPRNAILISSPLLAVDQDRRWCNMVNPAHRMSILVRPAPARACLDPAARLQKERTPRVSLGPRKWQKKERFQLSGSKPMNRLPLNDFRVIDLTAHRAGPTAVRQLADWGARVVKIEPTGELVDATGSRRDGPDFQNLHRNKRAMTLNLKSEQGRAIFMKLAERADVIVENYKSDVKHRLGIDYEAVREVN